VTRPALIVLAALGCAMLRAAALPSSAVAQRACRVAAVIVSPPDAQVDVGRTTQFFATAFDAANNPCVSVTDFAWSSSNPRAVTIDRYGVATGVAPGVTIIAARFGTGAHRKAGEATLQVVGVARSAAPSSLGSRRPRGVGCAAWSRQPQGSGRAEGFVVSPLRVVLVRGESFPLDYRAVRGDGANAEPVCVLFRVDPGGERVAQVDSFGLVTSLGRIGRAHVRVVVPGVTAWLPHEISVVVTGDSVRFAQREVSLAIGASDTLAMVVPSQGNRRLSSDGPFLFVSSDTSVVKVAPVAPVIRAVGLGTARITALSVLYPELAVTVVVRH
jgi:Bacterial Ig-like domain (group 2)